MSKLSKEEVKVNTFKDGRVEVGLPGKWTVTHMSRSQKNTWLHVEPRK